jgi:hypothetical protein
VPVVIEVKIQRTQAGLVLPFDKIYLFRLEDEALLPRIFPYAMVMPMTRLFRERMQHLTPRVLAKKHPYRSKDPEDDHTELFPHTLNRSQRSKKQHQEVVDWWEAFFEEHGVKNRLIVVPLLTKKIRKVIQPRYLSADGWPTAIRLAHGHKPQHQKSRFNLQRPMDMESPYDEAAYLITPNPPPYDKIRPLCSVCPRMLLHMQGECVPGDNVCYRSLDLNALDMEMAPDPYAGVPTDTSHSD